MIGYQIPNNAFESLENDESIGREGKEKRGYKKGRDNYLDALKNKVEEENRYPSYLFELKKKKKLPNIRQHDKILYKLTK